MAGFALLTAVTLAACLPRHGRLRAGVDDPRMTDSGTPGTEEEPGKGENTKGRSTKDDQVSIPRGVVAQVSGALTRMTLGAGNVVERPASLTLDEGIAVPDLDGSLHFATNHSDDDAERYSVKGRVGLRWESVVGGLEGNLGNNELVVAAFTP